MTKQNPAILIMAKVPRAGFVKTRLQPFLNESQSAELAVCFLKDTVQKAKRIFPNIIVAFSPNDGANELRKLLGDDVSLAEQTGENLGDRMQNAIEFAENKGFSPIIVIGTDSPNFPADYLKQATNLIENSQTEIVLGATNDGGYYLIGFRNSVKGIFENVEWSSEKTFAQTIKNAKRIFGNEPLQVADWYDVDTPAELKILFREYCESVEFAVIAPHTAKWLKENRQLFD